MSNSKQDRQGARTPADLERRYNFGKTFEEVYGIANSAKETASEATVFVDKLDNSLNQEEIFKRLTKNGEVQGVFMEDGEMYINAKYIVNVAALFVEKIISPLDEGVFIDMENGEISAKTLRNSKTDSYIQVGTDGTSSEGLFLFRDDVFRMMLATQPISDVFSGMVNWLLARGDLWIQGADNSEGYALRISLTRDKNDYGKISFRVDGQERGYIDTDGWHGWTHAEDLKGVVAIVNGGTGGSTAVDAISNLGLVAQSQYFQRSDGASPTQAELIEMIKAKAVELAQQNIPLKFPFTWHGKEYGFAEVFKYTNNNHHLKIFTASIGTKTYVGSGNGASWKEVT